MVRCGFCFLGSNAARGERGFTLLETVIAMGILGFVFLSVPGFLVVLERIEAENTARARTLLCAQEKLEEFIFASFRGGLSPAEGVDVVPDGPFEGMQRRWEIRRGDVGPGLMRVRAACSCVGKRGAVETALETLMVNSD